MHPPNKSGQASAVPGTYRLSFLVLARALYPVWPGRSASKTLNGSRHAPMWMSVYLPVCTIVRRACRDHEPENHATGISACKHVSMQAGMRTPYPRLQQNYDTSTTSTTSPRMKANEGGARKEWPWDGWPLRGLQLARRREGSPDSPNMEGHQLSLRSLCYEMAPQRCYVQGAT